MNQADLDQVQVLTPAELSGIIHVPTETLRRWRQNSEGPRWVRLGSRRIGYRTTDVRDWLETRYAADYTYSREAS